MAEGVALEPRFGSPRRHYRLTDSTNERAREMAGAGAPHGTVVTAAEQSAGRGRRGRTWSAPAGKALLCSAILRPLAQSHALLPLTVPLAVCDAIESVAAPSAGADPNADASEKCLVKWPNDVWLDERKVAGVLIEARPREGWAIIGTGLNVAIEEEEFPPDLAWPATSLGRGVEVEDCLRALCEALDDWVSADPGRVLAGFRGRDALLGRQIAWEGSGGSVPSGSGVAAGIADDGNLLVDESSGERLSLGAGDVRLRLG